MVAISTNEIAMLQGGAMPFDVVLSQHGRPSYRGVAEQEK